MGNAWAAKGDEAKSREYYEKIFPLLSEEPRCQRIDGERHALFINIGNTYVRNGDFTLADEQVCSRFASNKNGRNVFLIYDFLS